jgi:hypothetical protein
LSGAIEFLVDIATSILPSSVANSERTAEAFCADVGGEVYVVVGSLVLVATSILFNSVVSSVLTAEAIVAALGAAPEVNVLVP